MKKESPVRETVVCCHTPPPDRPRCWEAVQSPAALRRAEELLDLSQHLYEAVNLRSRVVEKEAGASGGFHAELAHQGLVAMVPAAQRDAALVGHGHHVVRMDFLQQEAYQPGAPDMRAEQPDTLLEPGELGVGICAEFLVVVRDVASPHFVEVIERQRVVWGPR